MLLSNGKDTEHMQSQEYDNLNRGDAIIVCADYCFFYGANERKEWFDFRAPPNKKDHLIGSRLIHKFNITYEEFESVCQLIKVYG